MSPAPLRPTFPRASARFTIERTPSTPKVCCVMPMDQINTDAPAEP